MSIVEGMIVTCDRCGRNVILKRIEDTVMDGGFYRYPNYEDAPQGWERIRQEGIDDLCPECYKQWKEIMQQFLSGGKFHEQSQNPGL